MQRALFFAAAAWAVVACGPYPTPVENVRTTRAPAADPHAGHDHAPGEGHDHEPAARQGMPSHSVHAPFAGQGAQGPVASSGPAPAANPHAGPAEGGETFAGVVRIDGEAAQWTEGYLFVSVVPAGTNSPACFDRLDLSRAREDGLVDGVRVVPFRYASCPTPPGDLELKVQLDRDGFVETKDEATRIGRFPIQRGDESIDVTLPE